MTEGFDQQIDAIMQRMRKAAEAFAPDGVPSDHPDADALSAFAENALPEKTKIFYTEHLADCDRCRQILADIISLNSLPEAKPSVAEIKIEKVNSAVPWYRRFFALISTAYALAALVMFFGGLLGFIVWQNSKQTEISQAPREIAPPIGRQPAVAANTPSADTDFVNAPINTNSAAASPNTREAKNANTTPVNANAAQETSVRGKERDKTLKEETTTTVPPSLLTTDNTAANEAATDGIVSTPLKKSPPAEVENTEKSLETISRDAMKMKPPVQRANSSGEEKVEKASLGGKNFTKRNNVWVDSEYRNQTTIKISRGSGEYQNLDQNLRQIVERLSGTVIVVWQGKAYRIQ